ncbi:MAG: DoxX family protein [Bacteroidetes bacterium]|nr:MAG: DoxX family protein [Bacteroidota bacterium]
MKTIICNFSGKLNNLQNFSLLTIRWILAYGFYEPAKMKWSDISAIASWFESMGMPMPALNAYMAATTEALGVVLLFLGLGVRIISFPLIITMIVAIKTVHWENGFNAGDNGFEIPLYYLIMLFTLMTFGGGKFGADYWIKKKFCNNN